MEIRTIFTKNFGRFLAVFPLFGPAYFKMQKKNKFGLTLRRICCIVFSDVWGYLIGMAVLVSTFVRFPFVMFNIPNV